MSFSYDKLPEGVDALRILILEPGDFLSPLVGTLTRVAFRDNPKYVALSYTWGDSYPDNAELLIPTSDATSSEAASVEHNLERSGATSTKQPNPSDSSVAGDQPTPEMALLPDTTSIRNEIVLSGKAFSIQQNLQLALRHIRSLTCSISIWADAICINQEDSEERNHQVSLMAWIYIRAKLVVAWLGMERCPVMTGPVRWMAEKWASGQTKHFGTHFGEHNELQTSAALDHDTVMRLLASAYWTRLWIVQEITLPPILIIMYGSRIWTFDEFSRACLVRKFYSKVSATRVLQLRARRHTETMKLEKLIEQFAKSACSEVRDRIYGLLGCANDMESTTQSDDLVGSLEAHVEALGLGQKPTTEPRRGVGLLRVDYHRSYYDIWANVVSFMYFQATGGYTSAFFDNKRYVTPDERQLNIVRLAAITQGALDEKVEAQSAVSVSSNA